ncbi:uncharacterized protein EV420DRAFT_1485868 [Desarmillaria tabescens]|uniref:Uncharacterized protein n=1 Tax=Armillaria tabescens TaxID=1929756 RepID=A0AA39MNX2_ARMTA|nr:uncharacterized protein EV420DRAFT_1485868 [Desarmillaria tabescens]KAK0440659.1 hypothetical protein EV420DRAFT_1485868 [Desarmillaria tabescens]
MDIKKNPRLTLTGFTDLLRIPPCLATTRITRRMLARSSLFRFLSERLQVRVDLPSQGSAMALRAKERHNTKDDYDSRQGSSYIKSGIWEYCGETNECLSGYHRDAGDLVMRENLRVRQCLYGEPFAEDEVDTVMLLEETVDTKLSKTRLSPSVGPHVFIRDICDITVKKVGAPLELDRRRIYINEISLIKSNSSQIWREYNQFSLFITAPHLGILSLAEFSPCSCVQKKAGEH